MFVVLLPLFLKLLELNLQRQGFAHCLGIPSCFFTLSFMHIQCNYRFPVKTLRDLSAGLGSIYVHSIVFAFLLNGHSLHYCVLVKNVTIWVELLFLLFFIIVGFIAVCQ